MLIHSSIRSARDRLLVINSMPNFAGVDERGRALLAEHSRARAFRAGASIVRAGEGGQLIHLLTRGRASVFKRGVLVTRVSAPGAVSIMSLLADDVADLSATADVDCTALELPAGILLDAFEENFSATRNALRQLATRLQGQRDGLPRTAARLGQDAPDPGLGPHRKEPRTLSEQLLTLSQDPLFARQNLDAVIDLARHSHERRVPRGTLLWALAQPADSLLRVEYGRVECINAGGTSASVGPGFVLGLVDALAGSAHQYRAVAATDLIVYQTEKEDFVRVLETHFSLTRGLLKYLASAVLSELSLASQRAAPVGDAASPAGGFQR